MQKTIKEIQNLQKNSIITLTVHNSTSDYMPVKEEDDSWDLQEVNNLNVIYGLSCCNLTELKQLLVDDCRSGIISFACIS